MSIIDVCMDEIGFKGVSATVKLSVTALPPNSQILLTLPGWLAGWLAAWLAAWLAGWLAAWPAAWLAGGIKIGGNEKNA